jgi:hypothetical protein
VAEVNQHDLQSRQDRVGEKHTQDSEQRGHQKLHRQQDGWR